MTLTWHHAGHLLGGPLLEADGAWPLSLSAVLCDLRSRFLAKGTAGGGHRAIARNGRVLLCSDRPTAELAEHSALMRLQTWHRAILADDAPEPYGLLLHVHTIEENSSVPLWATRLVARPEGDLWLDVGGGLVLAFLNKEDGTADERR